MKTIAFILAFIFTQVLYTQTYEPLLDANKKWNTLWEFANLGGEDGPPVSFFYNTTSSELSEEVSVEGVNYHQLIIDGADNNIYFREEDQKVYRYPGISEDEDIVYDFTLEVGDEIILPNNIDGRYETWQVTAVSYEFFAGAERKNIHLVSTYNEYEEREDIWYEGVGSLFGFAYSGSYFSVDNASILLCYHYNDEVLYQIGESCMINTANVYNETTHPFSIYPNPTTRTLTIQSNFTNYSIAIYNLLGEVVLTTIGSNNTQLDLEQLNPGIYLIEMNHQMRSLTLKLVKN